MNNGRINPNRIGVLTSGCDLGGAEKYAAAWIETLAKLGHYPALFRPSSSNYNPAKIFPDVPIYGYDLETSVLKFHRYDGLNQLINLPRLVSHLAGSIRSLNGLFVNFKPDVLVSFGLKSHLLMSLSSAVKNRAKIIVLNDVIDVTWLEMLFRFIFRLKSSMKVVSPSRFALKKNGLSLERAGSWIIPPPVDLYEKGEENILKRNLAINENTYLLTCVGNLTLYKGQDNFIRLIHILREEYRLPVHGLIVGVPYRYNPSYGDRLRSMADEQGIADAVSFLGWRDDVPAILSASDLLVHLSDFEVFGIAVVEAMASGCPVLAWNLEGLRDTLQNGVEGILIPKRDITALAGTAKSLLHDENKRKVMGLAGKKRIKEHFSRERFQNRITTLLEQIDR